MKNIEISRSIGRREWQPRERKNTPRLKPGGTRSVPSAKLGPRVSNQRRRFPAKATNQASHHSAPPFRPPFRPHHSAPIIPPPSFRPHHSAPIIPPHHPPPSFRPHHSAPIIPPPSFRPHHSAPIILPPSFCPHHSAPIILPLSFCLTVLIHFDTSRLPASNRDTKSLRILSSLFIKTHVCYQP